MRITIPEEIMRLTDDRPNMHSFQRQTITLISCYVLFGHFEHQNHQKYQNVTIITPIIVVIIVTSHMTRR